MWTCVRVKHTCSEMSLIWTSSVLHLPKSLISGVSATAGAASQSSAIFKMKWECHFYVHKDVHKTHNPKKKIIHYWGGLVSHRHWGRKRWNENVTFMCIRVSTKHHPKKSYKYLTKIIKHQLKTMISIRIKSFYI